MVKKVATKKTRPMDFVKREKATISRVKKKLNM